MTLPPTAYFRPNDIHYCTRPAATSCWSCSTFCRIACCTLSVYLSISLADCMCVLTLRHLPNPAVTITSPVSKYAWCYPCRKQV